MLTKEQIEKRLEKERFVMKESGNFMERYKNNLQREAKEIFEDAVRTHSTAIIRIEVLKWVLDIVLEGRK